MSHMDVGFDAGKTSWPSGTQGITLSDFQGSAACDNFVFCKVSGASKPNLGKFEQGVCLQATYGKLHARSTAQRFAELEAVAAECTTISPVVSGSNLAYWTCLQPMRMRFKF